MRRAFWRWGVCVDGLRSSSNSSSKMCCLAKTQDMIIGSRSYMVMVGLLRWG